MTSQTQTAAPTSYLAHIDGFDGSFASVSELKVWADALVRRNPDLMGKTCKVWKSIAPGTFAPKPTRVIVIGA